MSERISLRNYTSIFFKIIKQDKKFLIMVIMYGTVASIFNMVLPLSIQYIATQIISNASVFPLVIIAVCLFVLLTFYGILQIFQLVAFSYFEKKFFIQKTYNILQNKNRDDLNSDANVVQAYTEVPNAIMQIGNFIFTTSLLIQQFVLGLIITAFYHISFLFFNIILCCIIIYIFRFFFFRSITSYRREIDIRYMIGEAICDKNTSDSKAKHLLVEYYKRKNYSFKISIKQHVLFIGLYILANCMFLMMSGFLTLKGYITIPQFLASEIIFSLVFAKLGDFSKNLKNIYELLNATKKVDEVSKDGLKFEIHDIGLPAVHGNVSKFLKIVIVFVLVIFCGLFVVPWYQTSNGNGKIIAYNQEDRIQDITAMVSGRITSWYVNDGQFLKKGEKIAEISDNDPELISKLEREFLSTKRQYESSKLATETAKMNYNRQNELYRQGLSSRKDFEKAKIEYQKMLSYEDEINAKLMQVDVKFARQKSQIIVAPKDGFLLQSTAKSVANYVYVGEKIATFVPKITEPAIEVFIRPNDIPLIHEGRKVRIQIEGWPALRVSGWPSTSLGTFGGIVKIVDNAISSNGMFRVIIVQDPKDSPWPEMKYIKQGTKVVAWIRMNKVSIGYEIWRQINGFPIHPDEPLFTHHEKK